MCAQHTHTNFEETASSGFTASAASALADDSTDYEASHQPFGKKNAIV
jgi:hypothetical protein